MLTTVLKEENGVYTVQCTCGTVFKKAVEELAELDRCPGCEADEKIKLRGTTEEDMNAKKDEIFKIFQKTSDEAEGN